MLGNVKMGKQRFIKFTKGCKMTKIVRKGRNPTRTLKCPKFSKTKFESAQELVDKG